MFLSQLNLGAISNHQLRLSKGDDIYQGDYGDGLQVQEAEPVVKKPPMYKVLMLNDDYTPMEFVVHVLEHFFNMGREQATKVMLQVHTEGKAVCGVYTKDIAETKAAQVNQFSKDSEHPLLCEIDAMEDE